MVRPKSHAARSRCAAKSRESIKRHSSRSRKARRRTAPCRKRCRATSRLQWTRSWPDALPASWMVYLLRCRDGSLYTGITNDLTRRLARHRAGTASAYTRARRPLRLVYTEPQPTRSAALRREATLKRLRRAAELGLVARPR